MHDDIGRVMVLFRMFIAALLIVTASERAAANRIPDLTGEQWRDDVAALVAGIERNHRDAWNFASRREVMRLADQAAEQADEVDDYEMLVALQRIAAAIGDGHTFIAVSDRYSRYPFEVRSIDGEFYVARATQPHSEILGRRLAAIDGVPIDRAAEDLLGLVPRNENQWFEMDAVAHLLTQAEPLASFEIAHSVAGATFIFETPDGHRQTMYLEAGDPPDRNALVEIGRGGEPVAVEPKRGLRLRMLEDIAYLGFASYDDLEAESARVWAAIDRVQPRGLVIDFRENRGGSLPAGREYVVYPTWERSRLNREGCLFVLIGPATFSAAMTNVTDLRRETEATLVGLPTGARPNGYQENKWFRLPHSGLRVSAAQRRYRFGLPGETAVMPDLHVTQTIEDWRNGRDTILNAALSKAQKCDAGEQP